MSGTGSKSPINPTEVAWYAAGAVAILAVVAVLGLVIRGTANPGGGEADRGSGKSTASTAPSDSRVSADKSTTTTVDPDDPGIIPTDRVAYITADGRVMSGIGASNPVEVAQGAALGPSGLGSLAIAPTGDLIAFIRKDGAVVTVPVEGGEQRVLATDASKIAIGNHPSLAWNYSSSEIAYRAVGTEAMVAKRTGEQPPLSGPGAFRAPLPTGYLGDVVKIVDREGKAVQRMGDPSTRSVIGFASSTMDDFLVLETTIPGTSDPYTLGTATSGSDQIGPTQLSGDDPNFSPDGNFLVTVGPIGNRRELIRVSTVTLLRTVLTTDTDICAPVVSPDGTRIVYAAGKDCSKLMLISAKGGKPVEISPPAKPGTPTFRYGRISWTQEGHFIVFPDCRIVDGPVDCNGKVSFFDPDRSLLIPGIGATTVATVTRPLLSDVVARVALQGPVEYSGSFPVDANTQAELGEFQNGKGTVDVALVDGERTLKLKLRIEDGSQFAAGSMTVTDPAKGINRTFTVTGSASLLGVRIASLSGIWISTDDLPFMSGEFRVSLSRDT